MENRSTVTSYLEQASSFLLAVLVFAFPLVFTSLTTDAYVLPKQMLVGAVSLVVLLMMGAKFINEGEVKIRRTPFDVPVMLFGLFVLASSIVSLNRFDSLLSTVPLLFAIVGFFVLSNSLRTQKQVQMLVSGLLLGGSLVSILSILSTFKIYPLPFIFTKNQLFTPMGSVLEQAIFLLVVLAIAAYFAKPLISKRRSEPGLMELGAALTGLILLLGVITSIYKLVALQHPILLPLETGFQTAFAAISQDTGRIAQGFFLGSGFGTYATDFTRFKQAAFNTNPDLWALTFFRSSSFILELLATTGILGALSFIYLVYKILRDSKGVKTIQENAAFGSLLLLAILSFILPFSFVLVALFFIILGLYSAIQGVSGRFYDVELHLVAFKKGLVVTTSPFGETKHEVKEREQSFARFLPALVLAIFLLFAGVVGFYSVKFVLSDLAFQRSLVSLSQNNGTQTYQQQVQAIQTFPYRDAYQRVFSQTNLALANSIASQLPKDSSPSAQTQQQLTGLIQQSITAGRAATQLAPLTSSNWQSLGNIYRNLIGFAQQADSYAVITSQQAIALDPNNPQGYLSLGGLYYQFEQWDNAQRQFQVAVNLKPDFANAYYNLGKALEQKGELQAALTQFQTVRTLIAKDKDNLKKINDEIAALETKIGTTPSGEQGAATSTSQQPPLQVSTPSAVLPTAQPKVSIPPPPATGSAR